MEMCKSEVSFSTLMGLDSSGEANIHYVATQIIHIAGAITES